MQVRVDGSSGAAGLDNDDDRCADHSMRENGVNRVTIKLHLKSCDVETPDAPQAAARDAPQAAAREAPVSGRAGVWSEANAAEPRASASGAGGGGSGSSNGAAAIDEAAELDLGLDRDFPMDPLLEEIEAPRRPKKDDDGWGEWVDFLFCCGNTE